MRKFLDSHHISSLDSCFRVPNEVISLGIHVVTNNNWDTLSEALRECLKVALVIRGQKRSVETILSANHEVVVCRMNPAVITCQDSSSRAFTAPRHTPHDVNDFHSYHQKRSGYLKRIMSKQRVRTLITYHI